MNPGLTLSSLSTIAWFWGRSFRVRLLVQRAPTKTEQRLKRF